MFKMYAMAPGFSRLCVLMVYTVRLADGPYFFKTKVSPSPTGSMLE